MKFLHLADLHLGKRLHDVSLLEDQALLLKQVLRMAEDHQVDAVLIAGDIYQKASPQSEAMSVFDSFVTQLANHNIKTLIISGNHDSAKRISYFSSLLKNTGVYVSQEFDGTLLRLSLEDSFGAVDFTLLPFLKPVQVRRFFPDMPLGSYEDAVKAVLSAHPVDTSRRNVLLCHQFITGAEQSDSEEKSVGGLDNISASVFADYDYVALGHIHKAQRLTRDTLRYAGSLMKYSFSEWNHKKSVTLVEMQEKEDIRISLIPLLPPHDLRPVSGMLEEVMSMPYSEDYVFVTIHDELPPPDARVSISTVFPNMMKFSVQNSRSSTEIEINALDSIENKSMSELFCDFYRLQNDGSDPSPQHLELLSKILSEMEDNQ